MLKSITDSLEEVPEPVREFYKQREDGRFELQTDGAEALKRARDSEKESRRAAEGRAKELFEERERLSNDLGASKLREKQLSEQVSAAEGAAGSFVAGLTVKRLARELVGETNAFLVEPFIEKRLRGKLDGGQISLQVVDSRGGQTDLTVDQLREELRGDQRFRAIIVQSKASGSGATPSHGAPTKNPKAMSSEERKAFKERDPEGFKRAFGLS